MSDQTLGIGIGIGVGMSAFIGLVLYCYVARRLRKLEAGKQTSSNTHDARKRQKSETEDSDGIEIERTNSAKVVGNTTAFGLPTAAGTPKRVGNTLAFGLPTADAPKKTPNINTSGFLAAKSVGSPSSAFAAMMSLPVAKEAWPSPEAPQPVELEEDEDNLDMFVPADEAIDDVLSDIAGDVPQKGVVRGAAELPKTLQRKPSRQAPGPPTAQGATSVTPARTSSNPPGVLTPPVIASPEKRSSTNVDDDVLSSFLTAPVSTHSPSQPVVVDDLHVPRVGTVSNPIPDEEEDTGMTFSLQQLADESNPRPTGYVAMAPRPTGYVEIAPADYVATRVLGDYITTESMDTPSRRKQASLLDDDDDESLPRLSQRAARGPRKAPSSQPQEQAEDFPEFTNQNVTLREDEDVPDFTNHAPNFSAHIPDVVPADPDFSNYSMMPMNSSLNATVGNAAYDLDDE